MDQSGGPSTCATCAVVLIARTVKSDFPLCILCQSISFWLEISHLPAGIAREAAGGHKRCETGLLWQRTLQRACGKEFWFTDCRKRVSDVMGM